MASQLPAPYLIADHRGMEVLNSIGAPYGEMLDWMQNGQELVAWMVAAGFLTPEEGEESLSQIPEQELDRTAAAMRALREELRVNLHAPSEAFTAELNRLLSGVTGDYTIAADEEGQRRMQFVPRTESGADLMARVAVEVAELLCLNAPERLRECDGPTCTYMFRDTSRNNRRRWCSMAVCGNRAKVKAHRARQ